MSVKIIDDVRQVQNTIEQQNEQIIKIHERLNNIEKQMLQVDEFRKTIEDLRKTIINTSKGREAVFSDWQYPPALFYADEFDKKDKGKQLTIEE